MSNNKNRTAVVSRRGFIGTSLAAVTSIGLSAAEQTPQAAPTAPKPAAKIREYRTLGRTGFKVSDVSFGAGSLANANVLTTALDRGINYIDTAEHYENGGSERTIGEAVKNRERKSLFITTKLNLSFDPRNSKEQIKERFRKCLERMQIEYADCLMIHMCTLAQVKHEPYHEAIRELKAEGRVRFSGLSNHGSDLGLYGRLDDPMDRVVLAAVEDGRFDVVLFVYNYLKTDMGEKILAACKTKDMGTTLMKMDPAFYIQEDKNILAQVFDRYKARNQEPPEAVHNLKKLSEERALRTQEFLKKHRLEGPEQARSAAIKFCLAHAGVHCVCPTINNFADMETFISLSAQKFQAQESAMLSDYAEAAGDYYCRHACGTCQSACPHGVPVNTIMRYDYYFKAKKQEKSALASYAALNGRDAAPCSACSGPCQAACPYGVPIQGKLIIAHHILTMP